MCPCSLHPVFNITCSLIIIFCSICSFMLTQPVLASSFIPFTSPSSLYLPQTVATYSVSIDRHPLGDTFYDPTLSEKSGGSADEAAVGGDGMMDGDWLSCYDCATRTAGTASPVPAIPFLSSSTNSRSVPACFCKCLNNVPVFREDLHICVHDIHECSRPISFISAAGDIESIPYVFLPLKGQIVNPNAQINFNDSDGSDEAACMTSRVRYLSPSGWIDAIQSSSSSLQAIQNQLFQLFRHQKATFLQWIGSNEIRAQMEGRLVLVDLLCKRTEPRKPNSIFTPCISFRVAGSHNWARESSKTAQKYWGEEVLPSEVAAGAGNGSFSSNEYIVMGVIGLLLAFVYVAFVLVYLRTKRRKLKERVRWRNAILRLPPENVGDDEPYFSVSSANTSKRLIDHEAVVKSNPLLSRYDPPASPKPQVASHQAPPPPPPPPLPPSTFLCEQQKSIPSSFCSRDLNEQRATTLWQNATVHSRTLDDKSSCAEQCSTISSRRLVGTRNKIEDEKELDLQLNGNNSRSELDKELPVQHKHWHQVHSSHSPAQQSPRSAPPKGNLRPKSEHCMSSTQNRRLFGGQDSLINGVERHPDEQISIVECSEEQSTSKMPPFAFPTDFHACDRAVNSKHKLYFNPAYFEPEFLMTPPPGALEFLAKIREVMSSARQKMLSKKYLPSLTEIAEEEEKSETGTETNLTHSCSIYEGNSNGHKGKEQVIHKWLQSMTTDRPKSQQNDKGGSYKCELRLDEEVTMQNAIYEDEDEDEDEDELLESEWAGKECAGEVSGEGYSLVSEVYVNEGYNSGNELSSTVSSDSSQLSQSSQQPATVIHLVHDGVIWGGSVQTVEEQDFEPDTFDRKQLRCFDQFIDSLERPAISLRTSGSFRKDVSPAHPFTSLQHNCPSPPETSPRSLNFQIENFLWRNRERTKARASPSLRRQGKFSPPPPLPAESAAGSHHKLQQTGYLLESGGPPELIEAGMQDDESMWSFSSYSDSEVGSSRNSGAESATESTATDFHFFANARNKFHSNAANSSDDV